MVTWILICIAILFWCRYYGYFSIILLRVLLIRIPYWLYWKKCKLFLLLLIILNIANCQFLLQALGLEISAPSIQGFNSLLNAKRGNCRHAWKWFRTLLEAIATLTTMPILMVTLILIRIAILSGGFCTGRGSPFTTTPQIPRDLHCRFSNCPHKSPSLELLQQHIITHHTPPNFQPRRGLSRVK